MRKKIAVLHRISSYCEFKQFWLPFSIQESCDFCCILQIRKPPPLSWKINFLREKIDTLMFERKNLCLEKNCPLPPFLVFEKIVDMKMLSFLHFYFLWRDQILAQTIRFFTLICQSQSTDNQISWTTKITHGL